MGSRGPDPTKIWFVGSFTFYMARTPRKFYFKKLISAKSTTISLGSRGLYPTFLVHLCRNGYWCIFGRPLAKRFALCYQTIACPVFDVAVLWQNGWTDQDETWRAGRPQPWPHCVTPGPSSPSLRMHSPQFSVHFYCGQTAGCIRIPLGTEVGLSLGDIVLDGDPAPPPPKGAQP